MDIQIQTTSEAQDLLRSQKIPLDMCLLQIFELLNKEFEVDEEGDLKEAKAKRFDEVCDFVKAYRFLESCNLHSRLDRFTETFVHLTSFPEFPRSSFVNTSLNILGSDEGTEWQESFFSLSRMMADLRLNSADCEKVLQTFRVLKSHLSWPEDLWRQYCSSVKMFLESSPPATFVEFLHTSRVLAQEGEGWTRHPKKWDELLTTLRFLVDSDSMSEVDFLRTVRQVSLEPRKEGFWRDYFQATRHVVQFRFAAQMGEDWNRTVRTFPDIISFDFLSYGQVESKRVLLEELRALVPDLENKLTVLLGGWYGLFAQLLFADQSEARGRVLSVDIDERANRVAEKLNNKLVVDGWKFKTITSDIHEIQYEQSLFFLERKSGETVEICERPELYVNTSCEHIENFSGWRDLIPDGTLLALQSNNAFQFEGHVNCVGSLDEFKSQARLSEVLVERVIHFEDYSRFLLIGRA